MGYQIGCNCSETKLNDIGKTTIQRINVELLTTLINIKCGNHNLYKRTTNCLHNLINDNFPKSTIKRKRQQSNEATLNHYSGSLCCINSKVLGDLYLTIIRRFGFTILITAFYSYIRHSG